jgi:uncharacterized membrane protein YciS (DUF1049 family)
VNVPEEEESSKEDGELIVALSSVLVILGFLVALIVLYMTVLRKKIREYLREKKFQSLDDSFELYTSSTASVVGSST